MATTPKLPETLTVREVANLVGLTYDQVYVHITEKGTLKAQKILGRYVINRKDFEAWDQDRKDNFQTGRPNMDIILNHRRLDLWTVPVIEFSDAARTLCLPITGHRIVNSVTTNQEKLRRWKGLVASRVKEARGPSQWNTEDSFAITVGFSFSLALHGGNRPLDVDNFTKPIIDALAAGLFCDAATDPQDIPRYNYDDSNFSTLLIHRLANADRRENEGVAIYVSSKPK